VKKVLVVDDEPVIRDLLTAVLGDEGYDVIVAADGFQGVELVAREQPDLVLMDVMMPGLDGREAFRMIRSRPDLPDPPVIMMSAAVNQNRLDPMISGHLAKPFDVNELLEMVSNLLD
jgi:CheY-like chemotaxis protein